MGCQCTFLLKKNTKSPFLHTLIGYVCTDALKIDTPKFICTACTESLLSDFPPPGLCVLSERSCQGLTHFDVSQDLSEAVGRLIVRVEAAQHISSGPTSEAYAVVKVDSQAFQTKVRNSTRSCMRVGHLIVGVKAAQLLVWGLLARHMRHQSGPWSFETKACQQAFLRVLGLSDLGMRAAQLLSLKSTSELHAVVNQSCLTGFHDPKL